MQPDLTHINHNHESRGTLMPDCPGCDIVKVVMSDAGLVRWASNATPPVPLARGTLLRHLGQVRFGHDLTGLVANSADELDHIHIALHAHGRYPRAHYADQPRELHVNTARQLELPPRPGSEYTRPAGFTPHTSNPDEHAEARRRQLADRRKRQMDTNIDALKSIQRHNGVKAAEMESIVARAERVATVGGLEIAVAFDKPHTYAIIQIIQDGKLKPYLGIGRATCQPDDAWSDHIGTTLAIGRGLRAIGQQVSLAGRHIDALRSIK